MSTAEEKIVYLHNEFRIIALYGIIKMNISLPMRLCKMPKRLAPGRKDATQRNKSHAGFVKCTPCVKYAPRVKCAAARERFFRTVEDACPYGFVIHYSSRNV